MKSAMGNKLGYGIVVAIVSILVIVILSIWQYRRIQDTGVIIRHTNLVLFQTQAVENSAVQYELNVKNFLLTGDSSFLLTSADSLAVLPREIRSLKTLTADNPIQQRRIDSLELFAGRNTQTLEQIMRQSRAGKFEGPSDLIAAGTRAGYAHDVHSVILNMQTEERRLLDIRRSANQLKASQLQYALWFISAAVALLAVIIFRKTRIDLVREQTARGKLFRFNIELEEEVRRKTANLQASEDKYKTLFNKSPLPKWIYDEKTLNFLEVNDTAIRVYGFTREEFLKMTIADIRPPEDVQALLEDVEDVRGRPGSYRHSQWRHVRKDQEIIDVEITAHAIEYDGKQARMVIVNDITENKRYEQELRRLNTDLSKRAAELTASNAELERFAYIASHDLQEPLRMVTSFLQLLQKKYRGQIDSKADQYIHYAVDGAERMKALIMDLLEYSRAGSGKEGFVTVDAAVVLQEVGDIFREKIVAARADIKIDPLPVIWCDKLQLLQLFQNLLSNALKYHSDQPPVIHIRSKEEPGHWLFSVQDNGIGIDPQFFDKIFIIFQRLHNKTDYSGTGIGLAICKKIVERHGGRIWVESAAQQGSTFFFTINKKT
jgi:PAS domain S-box-containing protein